MDVRSSAGSESRFLIVVKGRREGVNNVIYCSIILNILFHVLLISPLLSLMASTEPNGHTDADDPQATIEQLREELRTTQEEKESMAVQHHNLVSKVSNIRNTLGAKLKQDAVLLIPSIFCCSL